jgi:hypothetical protein
MDSNARSTTWHGVTTNYRGTMLEEFVSSYQLHIINEDSTRKTFQSNTRMLEDPYEMSPIQIPTDRSKTEKGVGAGIAIFK